MRLPFIVRRVTSAALRPIRVRIRNGPNAGKLWSLAAAGRHRRGTFESERLAAIQGLLGAGDCFWEFGAHHGYVTVLASTAVGETGLVYAFEPSSYNFAFLQRHVRWNRCANTRMFQIAIAHRDGTARFGGSGSSQTFHLGGDTETVRVATIATLMAGGLRPPDVIKIDIEGAEADVIEHGGNHFNLATRLMISIHSLPNYERVTRALTQRGFAILESAGIRSLTRRGVWGDNDPAIVAVGPGHSEVLQRLSSLAYFSD